MATNVTAVSETALVDDVTVAASTEGYGDVTEKVLPYFVEFAMSLQIQAWAGLVIVIVGLVGNILSIAVLSRGTMKNSTGLYLVNLAVSDLGVIVVGQMSRVFPRALTGFDTGSYDPWICKWWFFVNHSFTTISAWTLIAVTIERTCVVYMPLKAKSICTRKRAKIAIVFINILCAACYVHYFWTYGEVYEERNGQRVLVARCSIIRDNPILLPYILYVRPWQDFIVRSIAPFTCLLICNCLIIGKLLFEQKKRNAMSSTKGGSSDSAMASMTAMLVVVSFAHLICISPLQIMYLYDKSDPFGWTIRERWQALVALRWAFAIDVYYLNHAINFILYCISGREFRRSLFRLFAEIPCCQKMFHLEAPGSKFSSTMSTTEGTRGRSRMESGTSGGSENPEMASEGGGYV